jgi:very-short-patch-repair endonuclease
MTKESSSQELSNFIKYCLGYIRLTRQKTIAAQQRHFVNLDNGCFDGMGLLARDLESTVGEPVRLETFYSHDPKQVPEELKEAYETEHALANKIEDIYNRHANDPFTKQVTVNFGYFELELPLETVAPEPDADDVAEEDRDRVVKDRFPLFSLTCRIDKSIVAGVGRYSVLPIESEVLVNAGMLEKILEENLYFQLLEKLGQMEVSGNLNLPITSSSTLLEIWHLVKAQLKLGNATFDEASFSLNEIRIALSPRANYFLAEDLLKLSKLPSEVLTPTALNSWVSDDGLNISGESTQPEELYFPFSFDKYKVRVLSLLANKAAIVEGPPGTGKSETIANLLCHLAANRKRVLFVSQKTQALKVVKDRLRRLDLPYLFGYIPNPGSPQSTEEDENDGVAARLTALDTYLQRLQNQSPKQKAGSGEESLPDACALQKKARSTFNHLIEDERNYFRLATEREQLKPFIVEGIEMKAFDIAFSGQEWLKVINLRERIDTLDTAIKKFIEQPYTLKSDLSHLVWNGRGWSEAIQAIGKDIELTGYDRRSLFMRRINNGVRKLRCRKIRSVLPRELIDLIDRELAIDQSRSEMKRQLNVLDMVCRFHEDQADQIRSTDVWNQSLKRLGLTPKLYPKVLEAIQGPANGDVDVWKSTLMRFSAIEHELSGATAESTISKVVKELSNAEVERRRRVIGYIQAILNKNLIEKSRVGVRIRQITARLAKAFGKSKKAFKTFDSLRQDPENFKAVLDLIPVWIMELDDASRIIPLEPNLFDYVILDEASQCNVAYTLPTMFRATRALFVGDSEQMRDNTVMFKSNKAFDELAHRYSVPQDLQIKASGSAVQSVLDIARLRGLQAQALQYHYRSPAELIGFSNEYFYKPKGKDLITLNYNYLTYKDTGRIMVIHQVQADEVSEIADNSNIAEAHAILECFKDLRKDPRTANKSIGILTFFNAQAACLRKIFEDAGLKESGDNFKISIIEGIQGDEKDIVLYSFVIRTPSQKRSYVSLTGESGDIRADINMGRVNVAFSRARQQVHCFTSLAPSEFPDKIWIKRYLNYVEEHGLVRHLTDEIQPFDSHFEEEFYALLRQYLTKDFHIRNQVRSCGFKIDFVVRNIRTGRSLAIECDGPTHFKDEIDEAYGIHVESDEERQSVLEGADWHFYRIKYSDWRRDDTNRKYFIDDIMSLLK